MLIFKQGKSQKKGVTKYWHVYDGVQRIGYAYLSKISSDELGSHDAINVFVNKAFQRKGYGREIFKQISDLSGLKVLYAHSSKSNAGSYHAASKAGYKEIENKDFRQRVMIWKK